MGTIVTVVTKEEINLSSKEENKMAKIMQKKITH